MEALFSSFLLVFVSEMGDKTQLLALLLTTRYRKPWMIFAGVLVATLLNHALAASIGGWVAGILPPLALKWILTLTFAGFAFWILVPDKEGEIIPAARFGVFLTTVVSFFLAEMGDKTQLATVALGARYASAALVTLGTTLGMLAANALAIFLGRKILARLPMRWVRIGACGLFLLSGLALWLA
jgi:putative Ca2+/H+ antiporter (TMEM165/GDT1 family)